jgi:hypothetical protein
MPAGGIQHPTEKNIHFKQVTSVVEEYYITPIEKQGLVAIVIISD